MTAWRRVVVLAALALAGCDAGFGSQIEVTYASARVATPDAATEAAVVAALNRYAQANGLACGPSQTLPLRCAKQPISIAAVRTEGGATVCYGAQGIPLESSKFQRRIDELAQALARAPGASVVASPMNSTMSAACQHAWRELDDARL